MNLKGIGKIDLNRTSSAKIIELFHFVLPAGTMKKWTVPGEGHSFHSFDTLVHLKANDAT